MEFLVVVTLFVLGLGVASALLPFLISLRKPPSRTRPSGWPPHVR